MPDSEPRLIRGYLDTLAARLPASVTDELADGLTETYQFHRSRGLAPEAAAMAASSARIAVTARLLRPALAR